MNCQIVVPPAYIVTLMAERAERLTSAKGLDRAIDVARIARALVDAWGEGVCSKLSLTAVKAP